MCSHCESMVKLSEDNNHSSYMLTLQAGWWFPSTFLLFLQNKCHRHSRDDTRQWNIWQHPAFLSIFAAQHTDTCHVTRYCSSSPIVQSNQPVPWCRPRSVRRRASPHAFHLPTSLITSDLRRCCDCSLTNFTKKVLISREDVCLLTNRLVLLPLLCRSKCMPENCFEVHQQKQELQSSSLSLSSLPDCL